MTPEGYYAGKILTAWLERDDRQQSDSLVMCFECDAKADDGTSYTVTARHMTDGKLAWSGVAVAELLGIAWPDGLREIAKTAGREVRLKVIHKANKRGDDVYENAYIVTPSARKPATAEQIEAGLARLRDEEVPF